MRSLEEMGKEHKATNCVLSGETKGTAEYMFECLDCRVARKSKEEKGRNRASLRKYVGEQLATIGIKEDRDTEKGGSTDEQGTGTDRTEDRESSARLRRLRVDREQRCTERRNMYKFKREGMFP